MTQDQIEQLSDEYAESIKQLLETGILTDDHDKWLNADISFSPSSDNKLVSTHFTLTLKESE